MELVRAQPHTTATTHTEAHALIDCNFTHAFKKKFVLKFVFAECFSPAFIREILLAPTGGPRKLLCCQPAATQASVMNSQRKARGPLRLCASLRLTSIKSLSKTKARSETASCSHLSAAAALEAFWRLK